MQNDANNVSNDVASVLSNRELITLDPEQTIRSAAQVLSSEEIGAAPVMIEGNLVGVLSERDILKKVVAEGESAENQKVSRIMTENPQTVTSDTSLVKAFGMMLDGHFRHLPVLSDGKIVAMLSIRDIPPEHHIMHRQWSQWTQSPGTNTSTAQGNSRLGMAL